MKICTVLGARPQFIKAATVSKELAKHESLEEIVIHTGQHYDKNMSDIFFDELGITKPDYHLNIGSGPHGKQTGKMLAETEDVLVQEKPDLVIVYGDTNSTLAGALAASKLHIPIAHVEAGLRSFNKSMPEEINRILTDHVSEELFCPTNTAVQNLLNEGFNEKKITLTGDVMYDASQHFGKIAEDKSHILERQALTSNYYLLTTFHRAENTGCDKKLKNIFDALELASKEIEIVLPLHPRTKNALDKLGISPAGSIKIIPPVGYLDMVKLEKHAALILTDSGGVQKEAFFHKKPCITIREETEWTELVESGWNTLVNPLSSKEILDLIFSKIGTQGKNISPYGEGNASVNIAKSLLKRQGKHI